MTFRDKDFRDARGNPSNDNFLIRGCFFTSCGKYVFLLAAKMRYKSFLIKYQVTPNGNDIQFTPISTLEVHSNAVTRMKPSRDDKLIAIASSDGFIKTVDLDSLSVIMGQKRHNLPVTAIGFLDSNNFNSNELETTPNQVITGSADYLYNIIKLPESSMVKNIMSALFSLLWH